MIRLRPLLGAVLALFALPIAAQAQCPAGAVAGSWPCIVLPGAGQPTDVLLAYRPSLGAAQGQGSLSILQILTNPTVTGTLSTGNITQNSTGNWALSLATSSGSGLLEDSTGTTMLSWGGTNDNVQANNIIWFAPTNLVMPTTPALSVNGVFYSNTNWTGNPTIAVAGATSIYTLIFTDDVNMQDSRGFRGLYLDGITGSQTSGNLYSIDAVATMPVSPADALEIHAGRFTANADANEGGTAGSWDGNAIGIKAATNIEVTATYLSTIMSIEDVTENDSPTSQIVWGLLLESSGAYQGQEDDSAIAITVGTGNAGWANGITFGSYSIFNGVAPCGTGPCTFIYGEGTGGTGFTAGNGVDWHLATFTGNSWNDGHITLTGTGHLLNSGSAPAVSACGATSAPDTGSTDMVGSVSIPAGTTSCTVVYATAFTGSLIPVPVITPGAAASGAYLVSKGLNGFVIGQSSLGGANDIGWHVMQ